MLERDGYSVALVNARFICPLDEECISHYASRSKLVCTLEDHIVSGGFGSHVLECLQRRGINTPIELIGWPSAFIEHGSENILREKYGLTPEAIHYRVQTRIAPQP